MSKVSDSIKKFRPEVKTKKVEVRDQYKPTLRWGGKPLEQESPAYKIIKEVILKRRGIYK